MQQKLIIYSLYSVFCILYSVFCPPPSTSVENALQIGSFMQNKPNFPKSQMNVNPYKTTDYENIANWTLGQNKPNSNPIKPNCRKGKIDAKSVFTKDYRKKDDFAVRKNKPNSNPISVKPKMSANLYVIEDYENETTLRPRKNKPKQTQLVVSLSNLFQTRRWLFCLIANHW